MLACGKSVLTRASSSTGPNGVMMACRGVRPQRDANLYSCGGRRA